MKNRVKIDKKCIRCGEIPDTGYFMSSAANFLWICPECHKKQTSNDRRKRRKRLLEANTKK